MISLCTHSNSNHHDNCTGSSFPASYTHQENNNSTSWHNSHSPVLLSVGNILFDAGRIFFSHVENLCPNPLDCVSILSSS